MSNNKNKIQMFSKQAFLKSALPAYFFPLIMSGGPAYFLNKPELLKASYSTIALPSLIATVICFFLLKYLKEKQLLLLHRIVISLLLIVSIGALSLLIIQIFDLWTYLLDILPSAALGAGIIGMTKPLKKN